MIILKDGKKYRRRDGQVEEIGGTTRAHPEWAWSIQGNWYERATGRAVAYSKVDGEWKHYVDSAGPRDVVEEAT